MIVDTSPKDCVDCLPTFLKDSCKPSNSAPVAPVLIRILSSAPSTSKPAATTPAPKASKGAVSPLVSAPPALDKPAPNLSLILLDAFSAAGPTALSSSPAKSLPAPAVKPSATSMFILPTSNAILTHLLVLFYYRHFHYR